MAHTNPKAVLRLTLVASAVFAALPVPARAQPEAPGTVAMAPVRTAADALSMTDRLLYRQALDATARGDWTTARTLARRGADPIGRDLVEWQYLTDGSTNPAFEDLRAFLAAHPDWPRRDAMLARAEKLIPPQWAPGDVIAWFGSRVPSTAEGKIRLGGALIALGQSEGGAELIRSAWIEGSLDPALETQVLQEYSPLLSPDEQRARLNYALARDDIAAARRQLSRVDDGTRKLGETRLLLRDRPAQARTALPNLPDSDAGLVFDHARALRRNGDDAAAWAALLRRRPEDQVLAFPERWWSERHIMARDALKAKQYQLAYDLASGHGLTSGGNFADAEFLSGWLALRFLDKPEVALTHFQTLSEGVSLPISKARGYYWRGRALDALDRGEEAVAAYTRAAEHPETFYGQLAIARLHDTPLLRITSSVPDTRETALSFEADDRVRAARAAALLGDRVLARIFTLYLASEMTDAGHLKLLVDLASDLGDPALTVRVAKQASYDGVLLLDYSHPLMDLPRFPGAGTAPEPALVLGLTRQESEFDATAVSGAGARGLMQLMPASARSVARKYGVAYRVDDLVKNPSYNVQLGMGYLAGVLETWNGSYILAIASYNAGPTNVKKWIETNGDPRSASVDPIDWIEMIPFGETRNYVQRVLENLNVYRNRLAGDDQPLRIVADLHRTGAAPSTLSTEPARVPPVIPVPSPAPRADASGPTPHIPVPLPKAVPSVTAAR